MVCKQDVKSKFLGKCMKAILQYTEKSRKKNISNKLVHLGEEGKIFIYILDEASPHVTTLNILAECLGKGEKTLSYIYTA